MIPAYTGYVAFVGGGPVVLFDNSGFRGPLNSVSLQFQQALVSQVPTTGTLTFDLTWWDDAGHRDHQCIVVTRLQVTQSQTFTIKNAFVRIQCQVSSDIEFDKGIPVTILLQTMNLLGALGKECSKKKCPPKRVCLPKLDCGCQKCRDHIIAKQPCPQVQLLQTSTFVSSTIIVAGTGFNIMYLNPTPCGAPMIPLLSTGTLTQDGHSITSAIALNSAFLFQAQIPNLDNVFVSGPATLTIQPTRQDCPAATFPITLVSV